MKKYFLVSLSALMVLSACNVNNSQSENSASNMTSIGDSTSNEVTSQENSSGEISSEDTLPPVSGETSNSTSTPTPVEGVFLDEQYESFHYYDPQSYDITEVIPSADPYSQIDTKNERTAFHNQNYTRATSYEDAMYRTNHFLISGDVKDTPEEAAYTINHFPNRRYKSLAAYRIDEGQYEYNPDLSFKSYTINNLEGKNKDIYYGAAYVTLEDVAAYLFAFAEAPANWKSSKSTSVSTNWDVYERANNSYFSANTDDYMYEPDVPRTDFDGERSGEGIYKYYEIDFGYTQVDWTLGYTNYKAPYNNGNKITRGPVRFVYTARDTEDNVGAQHIPLEHRHVFLTYNHYNDFVEYLNYENGWGVPFGWMSAGNEYCSGMSASDFGKGYYEFSNPNPKVEYTDNEVYRTDYQGALDLLASLDA